MKCGSLYLILGRNSSSRTFSYSFIHAKQTSTSNHNTGWRGEVGGRSTPLQYSTPQKFFGKKVLQRITRGKQILAGQMILFNEKGEVEVIRCFHKTWK
ncbi:hypothetical protein CDAR_80571 [Caerostris darwini]|uniref:Uncharacterized protein n=1 Tax=Caerostris darwini TaxID=1538125 RepID=A0AAV4SMF1_9ARAC|nr:hypothetical protein CDAR_80571 [Caerostris darwini]